MKKHILSVLLGISKTDSASINTKTSYNDLSFDKLLNSEVMVASEKAEKISDTLGMITS